jgi:hypothetical protein
MPVGTLVVHRPKHFGRDMFRAYKVAVRTTEIPSVLREIQIRIGATVELELPVGSYLIQATIAWCASQFYLADIVESEALVISCAPNLAYQGSPVPGSQFANDYIRLTAEA